jgi:hypothetical protein
MKQFYKDLKIGKQWESRFLPWMQKYFSKSYWTITDTTDIHRDEDGDQFPDYTLIHSVSNKVCFVDAKKRCVYTHKGHEVSFGFDKNFFNSYTNIAKKYNTKVYVAFIDPEYDPDNLYMLDMDQPPSFIHDYGNNGHGQPICYRWYVNSLKKYKIED